MQQFTYYSPTILRETLDGAAFVDLRSKLRSPCPFSLPLSLSLTLSPSLTRRRRSGVVPSLCSPNHLQRIHTPRTETMRSIDSITDVQLVI